MVVLANLMQTSEFYTETILQKKKARKIYSLLPQAGHQLVQHSPSLSRAPMSIEVIYHQNNHHKLVSSKKPCTNLINSLNFPRKDDVLSY